MDARLGIGLGDDERLGPHEEFADRRRRVHDLAGAAEDAHVGIAQDAERRQVGRPQRPARRAAGKGIFAQAQEGEVVVTEPFDEGDRLGDLGPVDRRGVRGIFRRRGAHPGEHGRPVLDRRGDVGEHLVQARGEPVAIGFERDARDVDLDQAFADRRALRRRRAEIVGEPARTVAPHRHDRVGDEEDAAAGLLQLGHHRIDEEGHVVVEDLDDRHRLPARDGDVGEPDEVASRPALGKEAGGGAREGGKLGRRILFEVLEADAGEEVAGERRGDGLAGQGAAGRRNQPLSPAVAGIHGQSSSRARFGR
jgi:hypothetical protein